MIKSFYIASIHFLFGAILFAQEAAYDLSASNHNVYLKSSQAVQVNLPFVDDFANQTALSSEKWEIGNGSVNSNLAINPISIGVLTLDLTKSDGSLYEPINVDNLQQLADVVTSQAIQTNVSPANDSVYFTFFYQPAGHNDPPEEQDSLVLSFYDGSSWKSVWRASYVRSDSMVLEISGADTVRNSPNEIPSKTFSLVHIPLDDRFEVDSFKFRFSNYASYRLNDFAGRLTNADLWHIDYIKIDANRTIQDTIIQDIAFAAPITSVFNTYHTIPLKHFFSIEGFAFEWSDAPVFEIRNNDTVEVSFGRSKQIEDKITDELYFKPTGEDVISGSTVRVFNDRLPTDFTTDVFEDYFTTPGIDSAHFEITYFMNASAQGLRENDTVKRDIFMTNYYAYDDGIPEKGYGLIGDGARFGKIAVQFDITRSDSIGAFDIYFNRSIDEANAKFFDIAIWNALEQIVGDTKKIIPGRDTIAYKTGNRLDYDLGADRFQRFYFDQPIWLEEGTYFMALRQISDEFYNFGYDLSRNNNEQTYVNTEGSWSNATFDGTLMLRPVFGVSGSNTNNNNSNRNPSTPRSGLDLVFDMYPIPASEVLYFEFDEEKERNYTLYNVQGQTLDQGSFAAEIDVSAWNEGFYFLKVIEAGKKPALVKILID